MSAINIEQATPTSSTENYEVATLLPALARDSAHDYLAPVSLPFPLPTPLFGAMLALWHLRPGLQRKFPLHEGNEIDFIRFLAWCSTEGRRHHEILREIPEWDEALMAPISLPVLDGDSWEGGYSVAMFLLGIAKHHYELNPVLLNAQARHRVACQFWRGERKKFFLPTPSDWQRSYLRSRFNSLDSLVQKIRFKARDKDIAVSQLRTDYSLHDLASVFAPGEEAGRHLNRIQSPTYLGLAGSSRRSRLYINLPPKMLRSVSWMKDRLRRRPTEFQLASITARIHLKKRPPAKISYPFGVNLFGYAKGELGIGEDVRLVAQSLSANNIPFCIVNIPLGANVSQKDTSVESWIVDEPKYAINIFCTTGIEQIRYACEQGLDVFRNRYTIGYWPWELPAWPESLTHAYGLVNEIWGISEYTANAYNSAHCPVYAMSLPVTIDSMSDEGRDYFCLPADDYLFVVSFDFNSTMTRKNPLGAIRAFQRAFPKGNTDAVGLVLKVSHLDETSDEWLAVKKLTNNDSRIRIIASTLRRPQLLALYKCCNCYVSLHRAEGFGRSIAEALLLDLQVVATGFSGNLDFCREDRVALVRFRYRSLDEKEYFHAQGQSWAEPDIGHAAELLRDVYRNPRTVFPQRADFSLKTIGERYAQRLIEIGEQFK